MKPLLTAFAAGVYLGNRYGRQLLSNAILSDFDQRAREAIIYTTNRQGWRDATEAVRERL